MTLKILHTSDWHTGRRLKERDRLLEFQEFFDWLLNVINSESINVLLVSGDIFDNTTPSAQAQNLYYSFLSKLAKSQSCRHAVITSGNHDSPAFIDAPAELLKLSNIRVIGQACENPKDEVLVLRNPNGEPELIICAVPFLRDQDVRTVTAKDDFHDIDNALTEGIRAHYQKVFDHASGLNLNVPIIAMGHLFVRGGNFSKDEGVRTLYVGTAAAVPPEIFPDYLAYAALGHLHSPQSIGRNNIRYSGSPLPMTFGEAGQKKSVSVLELDGKNTASIKQIQVPVFQRLERISGDFNEIYSEISRLAEENKSIWLEVVYKGKALTGNLQENLSEYIRKFPNIEILSVHDESFAERIRIPEAGINSPKLEEFSPERIFSNLLNDKGIPEEQQIVFKQMYKEILHEIESGGTE